MCLRDKSQLERFWDFVKLDEKTWELSVFSEQYPTFMGIVSQSI